MSTFYVMPSRLLVGRLFGEFLTSLFPGLEWSTADWSDLVEALGAAVRFQPGVYVLFREDLTCEDTALSLVQDFGAESGDQVIEVEAGEDGPSVRYWQMGWRSAA